MRSVAVVAIVAAVLSISGCGKDEPPPPPSVLRGVITEVTMDGAKVSAFSLEAGEERYEILIDPARDYGFDLTHLNEHRDTGDPVRVRLTQREEGLFAVRIDDA